MKKQGLIGTIAAASLLLLVIAAPGANAAIADPLVDVGITKTVSDPQVFPGDAFSYTLTAVSNGPSTAFNTQVSDTLPPEVTFVSANIVSGATGPNLPGAPAAGGCAQAGGVVTCEAGSLLPGQSATVTINVVANHTVATTCNNVAGAFARGLVGGVGPALDFINPDANPANNTASASNACDITTTTTTTTTIPPAFDVSLVKEVSASTVTLGDSTTFTITATNQGANGLTGLVVHDRIPAGLAYVSNNAGGAVVATVPASGGGGTLVWTIGNLAAGASTNFSFVATPLDVSVLYVNVAEVMAHNETDIDSTPGNNVLAEDDQDTASVIAQSVLQTNTTTTVVVQASTLPKTGINGTQSAGIGAVGLALLLLGGTLVLATRRRKILGRYR